MAKRIKTNSPTPVHIKKASWKVLKYLWVLTAAILLIGILFFFYLSLDGIPGFTELENPQYNQASLVLDNDGEDFGKYYIENRENIPFESISPHVVDALIATEDERYFRHSGIDFRALARVFSKTIILGKSESGGGSTITQQLAKLLFDRPNLRGKNKLQRSFTLVKVKLKEWITAAKLERSYTKEEIIAMYLNKFDFIYDSHGIQAASQTYFGKDQSELDIEEAAMLVGMLKNPWKYNPRRFPEKAKSRRNTVLSRMVSNKKLQKIHFDTLKVKEVDMSRFNRDSHTEGLAPYFRMELTKWLKDLLQDPKYYNPDGEVYDIYRDGLRIYTTIDLRYQEHAEKAMEEHMKNIQEKYWNVWKNRDPWKYNANREQKKIRTQSLNNRIRESERYQSIWDRYMGLFDEEIGKDIDELNLNDRLIALALKQEDNSKYLDRELRAKRIARRSYDRAKKLLAHSRWDELKTEYALFQKSVRKEFNTEVEMRVFDWNSPDYEKTTRMTPLDSVKYHRQHLQCGMLAVDPKTGYVKAWVGGINHKYFKFDHINSRRQTGSTFKPFVYATAIALQGISPCQEFKDIQYTIPAGDPNFGIIKSWSPSNSDGKFTGQNFNLYQGLLYSKNSITVKLMTMLGSVDPVRGLIHNMGIDSSARLSTGQRVVPRLPSICLGSSDLTVMEMTGAYTTFPNNGVYTKPVFVKRIEDKNGKVIYTAKPDRNVALNPNYNYVMVDMLRNNTATGYGFSGVESEYGGKTGTTNDYVDGWFMGITPSLVVGTWVGGEDPWIRFLTLAQGQGSVMARPCFANLLRKLEDDPKCDYDPTLKFIRPPGDLEIELDCAKYKQKRDELETGGEEEILQEEIFEDEFQQ